MRFPHMYPLVVFGVFGLFCSVAAVPVVVIPQNLTSRAPQEELTNQQWTDKAIEDIKNSFKRSSVELLRVGVTAGRFENEDEDLVRFYFNQEISTEVGFHMVRFDQGLQLPRRRDIEQKMARFVVEFEVVEGNERKTKRYRGAVLRLDEGRFIRSEEVNFGMMLPPEVQKEITLDDLNKMRERYCDSRSIEDRTEVLARRINALVEARHGRNQGRVGMVKAGFPNIHEPGRPYSAAHYTTTMDQAAKNLVSELFNKDIATRPTLLSFDPVHPYPLPGLLDLVEFELEIDTEPGIEVFIGAVWTEQVNGDYVWMLRPPRGSRSVRQQMEQLRELHHWRVAHNSRRLTEAITGDGGADT
ncbi:hypothetical protein EV361DRAFT_588017 [Lentinula raphanica]|uniref:Uncharacterized protein n=1 Tax=Lentinula raphanica TaxID=153919 RepID=A0AA38P5Z2_9AGAR|nr:hypothetical protein F5880DRAFT_1504161 [Lentinula raphanica]KAJ3836755.1 hypothetical protein F5878DRAFT_247996 [Lentinula raphanica]KAJ3966246.1 hypothetical protein EV361DRAFT_588017 [Lentinula raphanica]